jgi:Matrixin
MKNVMLGTMFAVGLFGCVSPESAGPTFEEFRAETARSFEGQEYFLISGDIALSEPELRAVYDQNFGGGFSSVAQHSIVNRIGNRDDKWTAAQALNLTYCVTNAFGGRKARMVDEMNRATAAWENVARVNFTYTPSQDGNCTGANRNVTFAVRPYDQGGACAFFPSGGGCVARTLVIDIDDLETNPFYQAESPNVRTVGVLRHELGHILGLRHEHTRPGSGTCFENNAWRALTPYDRNSVMHYPWCNGNSQSRLAITNLDASGARALYGAP